MHSMRVRRAGDAALVLELPAQLDPAINARVVAARTRLLETCGDLIRDAVVGYHTLTLYFDPLSVDAAWVEAQLLAAGSQAGVSPSIVGATVDIPVSYGGAQGPDLADVARTIGSSEQDVVDLHVSRDYRVFVVGFVPGFAYMGPVAPALALPRRPTPRTRVPPGSVAIAAGQTGIYPMETPGGWHVIGRTAVRPFDESRAEPVLFRPGDRVRFYAVPASEYERHATW
jgi:KipI family sensor histidine kinase inhibitor